MYFNLFYFYNIYLDLNLLHKNSHNLFHSLGIFKNSISVNCSEFDLTGYIFLKFHLIEKKIPKNYYKFMMDLKTPKN